MKNEMIKMQDKNLRLRSNNSEKSNVLQRVSVNFKKYSDFINKKREENGLDCLSYPKISELSITHKKYSKLIQDDIISYNTTLDLKDEEGFND